MQLGLFFEIDSRHRQLEIPRCERLYVLKVPDGGAHVSGWFEHIPILDYML